MSTILNYIRNKNKGLVLHEWDYTLKDNKINYISDVDKIRLDARAKHVEKIWLKANQNNTTLGNLTIVHHFFSNYAMNSKGVIFNIDTNCEHYQKQKQPTKNGDLYYVNLERLYDYSYKGKVYYDYYVQKYAVASLVACNFIPNENPKVLKYIEFIDGNRLNHSKENLRWTDKKTKKSLKVLI